MAYQQPMQQQMPAYAPAPMQAYPAAPMASDWQSGICGCCDDFESCLCGCCCDPCAYALAETNVFTDQTCLVQGAMYTLLSCCGLCGVSYCMVKRKIGDNYNLPVDDDCMNCLTGTCCPFCAAAQMYHESKVRVARNDFGKRGISQAPMMQAAYVAPQAAYPPQQQYAPAPQQQYAQPGYPPQQQYAAAPAPGYQ